MKYNNTTITIKELLAADIRVDKSYQREAGIWTLNQERELITAIINNEPIGLIILNYPLGGNIIECIDGQQRIGAIRKFIKGEVGINLSEIPSYYVYENFSSEFCNKFDNYSIPVEKHTGLPSKAAARVFTRSNTSGKKLDAQEERDAIQGRVKSFIGDLAPDSAFLGEGAKCKDIRASITQCLCVVMVGGPTAINKLKLLKLVSNDAFDPHGEEAKICTKIVGALNKTTMVFTKKMVLTICCCALKLFSDVCKEDAKLSHLINEASEFYCDYENGLFERQTQAQLKNDMRSDAKCSLEYCTTTLIEYIHKREKESSLFNNHTQWKHK